MRWVRALPRLNARISAVVGAGALIVAAGVALLLGNTVELKQNARSFEQANLYLLSVVNLERLVVDTETGLRGEVITGRALFLEPLRRAEADMPRAIAALKLAASQNAVYQPQTAALINAVRSYMSGYVVYVLKLAARDLPATRTVPLTLHGKHLVDGIRARVAQLEHLLSADQAARERSAHHTANTSIAEAIVVLVLLTLLTLVLGGYLGRLVLARERARDQSQAMTRTLQESLMPSAVPEIPGCELATRFIPGGGEVSGDFYDVVEIEPGEWALIIGDVCGKGVTAAASTAMARWTLRSALAQGASPAQALRLLNSVVLRHSSSGQFVTAACIKLSVGSQAARLTVACAGHPAPILVPGGSEPTAVDASGDLLGIMPTIRLHTTELELLEGDALVSYTDGVTDQGGEIRPSPEQALADRRRGDSAQQLAAALEQLAGHPAGQHPDDVAILALRFLGDADGATSAVAAPQTEGSEI